MAEWAKDELRKIAEATTCISHRSAKTASPTNLPAHSAVSDAERQRGRHH
jgi:hypothetical protein